MAMFGWRSRSSSAARAPRCDEPLSAIQNTRRAERYGSWLITWSTRRPKGARLTAAKDHRPMKVPRGQVLEGSPALVFVFNARRLVWAGWQRGMNPVARLDAGVRRQNLGRSGGTLVGMVLPVQHRPVTQPGGDLVGAEQSD